MRYYLTPIIYLLFYSGLKGQSPVADFSIPATSCINEQIEISNNSTNSIAYEWDFCVDKFGDNLNVDYLNDITSGGRNLGIDFIQVDGIWYGIATSWNNNDLHRLTFGNGLNNPATTITTISNPDNVLNQPVSIGLLEQGGIVYALIQNWGNSSLVKISFENGITDDQPSGSLVYSTYGGSLAKMELINTSSELKTMLVKSDATIEIIDFSNDVNKTITAGDVLVTSAVAGITDTRDIETIQVDGNWYAFIVSNNTGKIARVDFGTDIMMGIQGTQLNVTSNIYGSGNPNNIEIVKYGNDFVIHVLTNQGNLFKVNLGSDITNNGITSGSVQYGMGNSYVQGYSLKFLKSKGVWYGFVLNDQNTKLYSIYNSEPCYASIEYSTMENPVMSFNTSGTYEVELTAIGASGNSATLLKSITISSSLAPQLSSQITGNCLSSAISFEGVQDSGDINSWNWDFGDGSGTSSLQNDTYTYASAGSYQVQLNVTDVNGCSNLLIDTVEVYEEPVPDFTFPGGNLCMNNEVAFTNTSTGETGSVVNWTWDFNGEGNSTDMDASFIFTTSGSKTIELKSSIPGCANVVQKTIFIEEAPTTDFSFDNVCNGQATTFSDLTTGDDLASWNWDFGDGNNSTEQEPTHTYANPGEYEVVLSVSNTLGCTTELTQSVYNHFNPTVSFINDLACSTSPIQFTDQSMAQNANLVAWEWDFGDGNTSAEQSLQHLFGQTGDFAVQLKAYSEYGCVDSVKTTISVIQGPEVDFEWDKSCMDEETAFTDNTNTFGNAIDGWAWIIESNLKTEQNPVHTFNTSGTYPVQLSVTLDNNCAQTLTQEIDVKHSPLVQFDFEENCTNASTKFYDLTDQSNDNIVSREWRVDGQVQGSDSTLVLDLSPGTYSVSLSVVTNAGCEKTITSNKTLLGSPVAGFSTNTSYGAAPLTVAFTNLSSGGSSYEWTFGDSDNSSSIETNPIFIFTETGIYTVTLKASSDPDCFDEVSETIEVVEPETNAVIKAITPIEDNGKTNFVVTIENTGTTILGNEIDLVFRADYGVDVVEELDKVIYAGETHNYVSSFALSSNTVANNLCIEMVDSPHETSLDKNCIVLKSLPVISEPYPNPSNGKIYIDVIASEANPIQIRILNRSGQLKFSKSFDGKKGLNQVVVEDATLISGIYIVEITTSGTTRRYKATIAK